VLNEQTCGSGDEPKTFRREFAFPGDLASVPASRERLTDVVRQRGCDEAEGFDLTVALQEASANAALHGCGNDPSKTVRCSIELGAAGVCIVVRDPGPGFAFHTTADPARFSATQLTRGRGIPLMRGWVDDVTFARGGSEVRLSKSLSCHHGPNQP
jgi:anti-sigma regulatory factor (Ser/Thr protein kinase)